MKHQRRQSVPKSQLVQLYRQAVANGLPLEVVDKKVSTFVDRFQLSVVLEEKDDSQQLNQLKKTASFKTRMISHVIPVVSVIAGLFLLSNAAWPILSYFVFSNEIFGSQLLAPIPESLVLDGKKLAQNIQAQASTGSLDEAESDSESGPEVDASPKAPVMLSEDLDYTNLSNWFPNLNATQQEVLANGSSQTESVEYMLEIPKVDIEQARVRIGGTNLDHSLIQYPGTSNPGENGSPVIFGHSVLRQFYNPAVKNPRRYMSIFSKIMTLEDGDKIYLFRDNVKYTYTVQEKKVVKPTDIYILEQNYGVKELKLITCYPEGTYLNRGVIIATLDE